jgi:tetratricopeptide (TPR) repeat protein
MGTSKIFYVVIAAAIMSGCGLENMANKYNTIKFTTTPPTLQAHGGKVALSLDATFAERYFAKQATVDFTPVLVYNGGETSFKTITVQGEEATGGEKTIFNATGGSFKYQDAISYSDEMMSSTLELRAVAKQKDKEKVLGRVEIADGVIATSTRVQNTETLANDNHGYEHETILKETATIYFLVNQSNIRTTEKSNESLKSLKTFAKNGYKTHSIEIISYASPEGAVNTNDNISDYRMKNTVNYTKYLMRSLKVEGARNKDLYTETSVGEDWEGFESLVNESNIKDKRKINKIVSSISDVEVREQQIRDLAEIYDAIEDNVLPQLRKATIIIRSYETKRTDEEIATLSTTNAKALDINELLFSATLTNNELTQTTIYNKAVELHNDWRGYNSLACMYLNKGNLIDAMSYLEKAEILSPGNTDILTNKGIIASRKGQLSKAQKLFDQANTSENNQAVLDLRQGEYAKASRFFKNGKSFNATLAQVLNGNNSANCNEKNADCYYLNAIASARSANNDAAITNLAKAINENNAFKVDAIKDLEFLNLRTNEAFIALTK